MTTETSSRRTNLYGRVMTERSLRRTPLFDVHTALGARVVPFEGWEMPIRYTSIIEEHRAVRSAVGLFDVSHMGEFIFDGPGAHALLQRLTCNDLDKLAVGQAQYSMFLHDDGGTVDDLVVYRLDEHTYLTVVNAGNVDKDWAHVTDLADGADDVEVRNESDSYALLALQGPKAEEVLATRTDADLAGLKYYHVTSALVAEHHVLVARTGYTGEDGFELFVSPAEAVDLWYKLLEAGHSSGGQPAGLGARDTLRLEAAYPLYGHELDDDTSPLEAGLGRFVAKTGDYVGAEAIRRQREDGVSKKLVCLEMRGRGIPREGYALQTPAGDGVGYVTSGSHAPWLDKNIAMGYVPPERAEVGATLSVVVRDRPVEAEIVKRPFYKR